MIDTVGLWAMARSRNVRHSTFVMAWLERQRAIAFNAQNNGEICLQRFKTMMRESLMGQDQLQFPCTIITE